MRDEKEKKIEVNELIREKSKLYKLYIYIYILKEY